MQTPNATPDLFAHMRLIVGFVISLSVARLLTGLARFIQHPKATPVYPVHLLWALSMLLALMHFWWFEFRLYGVVHWNFAIYTLVFAYAVVLYFLCTLLFPDNLDEYAGFEDFFYSRRRWFFAILALSYLLDVADTWVKGADYANTFGVLYPVTTAIQVTACVVAMITANRKYHWAMVVATLLLQIGWIVVFDAQMG